MVINILFDFFKGGGDIVRGFSLVIWRGLAVGGGVLKLVGRGKEFCGPLSIQREFSDLPVTNNRSAGCSDGRL